jgi:hypothetical protein
MSKRKKVNEGGSTGQFKLPRASTLGKKIVVTVNDNCRMEEDPYIEYFPIVNGEISCTLDSIHLDREEDLSYLGITVTDNEGNEYYTILYSDEFDHWRKDE